MARDVHWLSGGQSAKTPVNRERGSEIPRDPAVGENKDNTVPRHDELVVGRVAQIRGGCVFDGNVLFEREILDRTPSRGQYTRRHDEAKESYGRHFRGELN